MGDHPHRSARPLHLGKSPHRGVKRLLIERAKALINEDRIQTHAPRHGLHNAGQAERQRKGSQEQLSSRQRFHGAGRPALCIQHFQIQPRQRMAPSCFPHTAQGIPACAELAEKQICRGQDIVEHDAENKLLERNPACVFPGKQRTQTLRSLIVTRGGRGGLLQFTESLERLLSAFQPLGQGRRAADGFLPACAGRVQRGPRFLHMGALLPRNLGGGALSLLLAGRHGSLVLLNLPFPRFQLIRRKQQFGKRDLLSLLRQSGTEFLLRLPAALRRAGQRGL